MEGTKAGQGDAWSQRKETFPIDRRWAILKEAGGNIAWQTYSRRGKN